MSKLVSFNANKHDIGSVGMVGMNIPAINNAKFFKVIAPEK